VLKSTSAGYIHCGFDLISQTTFPSGYTTGLVSSQIGHICLLAVAFRSWR